MIADGGGKLITRILRINRKQGMTAIYKHGDLDLFDFDIQERFDAINEGAARIQHIVYQHNTLLLQHMHVTTVGL